MTTPSWEPSRSPQLRAWARQAVAARVRAWVEGHRPHDPEAIVAGMMAALAPQAERFLRWEPAPTFAPGQRTTGWWGLDGAALERTIVAAFIGVVRGDVAPREPGAAELLAPEARMALAGATARAKVRRATVRTCQRCRRGYWPEGRERRCPRCRTAVAS